VDRIYHCPHHPHAGFPGEVTALKIVCDCRKPEPGLLQRAADDFLVERSRSFLIGDSPRDLGAAHAFGIPGIGLLGGETTTAEGFVDSSAIAVCSTVLEAVAAGMSH